MVCWGRARTHHWRLFPGFPWLPLQWPSGSILGAVRVGSYLDTLVLRNPLIAASNTHITSFLSLVSQVESGIKLTCFLWALQISGVSKRAFIGTNMLTSFSHLSALYFLHQAVVLWLCHSKSLVDRTDRTRGNINFCIFVISHTPTQRWSYQWCYVWSQGFYLLDVLLKLAICEDFSWWWVTNLMSDGVQQLLIQRLQLQAEIKWERSLEKKHMWSTANEWWYLQLLVSSCFLFRVFIFLKILKENSHTFSVRCVR